VIDSYKRGRT